MTAGAYQWKEHFALVYKLRLLPKRFSPQEASVATLCQVLHRQRLNLFPTRSSPRKFAECVALQCRSTSHLTCLVSFHRVRQSWCNYTVYTVIQVTFIQSYKLHSYIPTFIHSYNFTFIHSDFHLFIHSCIHNIYTTSIHT